MRSPDEQTKKLLLLMRRQALCELSRSSARVLNRQVLSIQFKTPKGALALMHEFQGPDMPWAEKGLDVQFAYNTFLTRVENKHFKFTVAASYMVLTFERDCIDKASIIMIRWIQRVFDNLRVYCSRS